MSTVLLWLRNDLRLHDQPVLHAACRMGAQYILPVLCLPDIQARTHWGFARIGQHRRTWLAKTIQNLAQSFHELRSQLLILNAPAARPCLRWHRP
jgi:deoxyribodipyrimidine photo-lyase